MIRTDVANQKQFPEVRGLQSPLLGQSLSFEPPFVQVLYLDTLHWVTVIGVSSSLVKVYDSVFNTAVSSLAQQTASILRTKSDVRFKGLNFNWERSTGRFAIAFATEFCYGNNPECYR